MRQLYQVIYNIGNTERTCIVMAESRLQANTLVANTEPDDVTIVILACELLGDNEVIQINERPKRV